MSWVTWPVRWVVFVLWFLWLVVRSNLTVLRDILTPGQSATPCITRYEARCRTTAEITLLAAAITLTPGTLTLGTRARVEGGDRRWTLYVHAMYASGPADVAAEVREIEDHLLHATRRLGVSA